MKLLGATVGALLGLGFAEYHNDHVSAWYGGYYFHPAGFLLLALAGAAVGLLVAWALKRERAT